MAKGFGEAKKSQKNSSKPSSLAKASDCEQIQEQWAEHFENLTDPRGKQGVLHPFMSIVMIAILATIGGAKGWEDIEIYGVSHENWLSSFLKLPYRLFLGQVKVKSKTNEITAIPALLALLDISGCIITIDAMGTQTEIGHRIQAQGADYVLALKANHPTLYAQVEQWFKTAQSSDFQGIEYSYDVRVESGHHPIRKTRGHSCGTQSNRWFIQTSSMVWFICVAYPLGQTIVRVVRTRHLWNKTEKDVMLFYLSSLPPDAQRLGKAIRQHWSIENQLHWVLDVTFGEDACRIRTGNAPENIALLKRWSINLLNQETSFKKSTRQKARRAVPRIPPIC